METSDSALAHRARAGDAEAFKAIVDRYYGDCLRFATRMLGNRADAEEVVQDAFVRAYRGLRRYDERSRLRAWLYRILVNRCRSRARRRAAEWAFLSRLQRLTSPGEFIGGEKKAVADGEVDRALQTLPPDLRDAFLLKYLEELSYPEMAEITGAGVSALKMRVKRACDRLAELLAEVEDG